MSDQIDLFEYLRHVALVQGRRQLHPVRASVVMFVALDSHGISGTRATVDAVTIATELGISPRQVWRHVEWAVENGWLEQTEKPTRGLKGKPGRRARYRLTRPAINLHLIPDRVTPTAVDTSDETEEVV